MKKKKEEVVEEVVQTELPIEEEVKEEKAPKKVKGIAEIKTLDERKAELKIGMCLLDGIGTVRNRELATYFLGEVEEFYKKIDNPIPERHADEINTAINLANRLFQEFGHDYAEEAEAWLDTKKEYAIP